MFHTNAMKKPNLHPTKHTLQYDKYVSVARGASMVNIAMRKQMQTI